MPVFHSKQPKLSVIESLFKMFNCEQRLISSARNSWSFAALMSTNGSTAILFSEIDLLLKSFLADRKIAMNWFKHKDATGVGEGLDA